MAKVMGWELYSTDGNHAMTLYASSVACALDILTLYASSTLNGLSMFGTVRINILVFLSDYVLTWWKAVKCYAACMSEARILATHSSLYLPALKILEVFWAFPVHL